MPPHNLKLPAPSLLKKDDTWRFEHSREPSFDEWDNYRGPAGLGGKMKGLDAELVVVVHELKSMAERRQGPTEFCSSRLPGLD